jgi:hypothetical protein
MKRIVLLLCLLLAPAAAIAQDPPSSPGPRTPGVPAPPAPPKGDPPPSPPGPTAGQETPPWMTPLKEADRKRIRNLAESRRTALDLAAAGRPDEVRALRALLDAQAQPLDPAGLPGVWRCRTFELGGIFPLSVTAFFNCRIRRDGNVLLLEKTSGSVLRRARLNPIDDRRMLMFGAYYASGDKPQPYGADDYHDEVGILERIPGDRLRIEIPEPRAYNTARHEVIELTRAR